MLIFRVFQTCLNAASLESQALTIRHYWVSKTRALRVINDDKYLVSKYVSMTMRRLALFICIFGSNFRNLTKICMNINIGYTVILASHIFHLRGQTKVAYIKMFNKHPFLIIYISIYILRN